ncbi:MAG TPA: serine kinase [Rhodanobacteraceae bacterium]|nr:serine kinase [Rhodanobacteraceae bacterium]
MRSNLEPLIDRPGAIHGGDGRHRKAFPPPEPGGSRLTTSKRVLGGVFRFESHSRELLELVEAAYGWLPSQSFPGIAAEFRVAMRLLPRSANAWTIEPPVPRIRQEGNRIRANIDDSNYVIIDPACGRAQLVATEDMLRHPYQLRCELIEFAVFVLATRGIGLAPLHAACVGIDGRGLLLLGASGSGKSTLALHGLLRGLDLLAEDAVFVHPATLLATGVPNYLHLRSDALDFIAGDAMLAWITHAPVIRRRSGVKKFELDLRRGYGRPAPGPLALVGAVFVSPRPADCNDALLIRLSAQQAGRMLEADQPNASRQPGWRVFKRGILGKGVYRLRRGHHPGDSVDALRRLLA